MKAFRNKLTGEWSKLDLVSEGQWGWFTSSIPFLHPDTCTIEEIVNYCEKTGGSIDMENMELVVLEDYFEKQFLKRYIKIFEKEKKKTLDKFIPQEYIDQNISINRCIKKLKKQLNKLK